MHDPLVVAFEIRRPWPGRSDWGKPPKERWRFKLHHDCGSHCEHAPFDRDPFPWWKPSSWSPFWTVAGRRWYFPSLITIWHREPGGRDSGEVCPHYVRWRDPNGKWQSKVVRRWKWHVHHWKIQVPPLQHLRRRALTRCAWCGGRSRKGDYVNVSHSWDGERGPWWKGELGLYHSDCSSVHSAHRLCMCPDPLLRYSDYGQCALCGRFRSYGKTPDEADRVLAALPAGSRIPAELRPRLEALWKERRERREAEA